MSLFSSSSSSSINHFTTYSKTRSSFGGIGIGLEDNNNVSVDQLKRKLSLLSQERDEALEDLKNVETAFSDLHKKYERAKGTMENLKKNEDLLIARDSALLKQLEARDAQVGKLREEMQSTLERMHSDYEAKGSSTDAENARLRASFGKQR